MTLKLILAFVIAFAVSAVVGFFLVPYLKRIKAGQSIKENGPTWHMSKQGTPTMGGLMFIAAIAVVCLSVGFECMAEGEYGHLFCLAFALVFGAIGFLDDYEKLKKKQNLGLTAGKKLLLQLAAAVAFIFLMRRFGYVALDSLYIPFWNKTVPVSEPLYVIFAAFVIVGTVNSVNLTDGVDGLAASTTMPVCIFFAVISMLWGERFLSLGVFASGLAGGLLGFLIYNFHPAKVFMGDTGSLFLGGAVRHAAHPCDARHHVHHRGAVGYHPSRLLQAHARQACVQNVPVPPPSRDGRLDGPQVEGNADRGAVCRCDGAVCSFVVHRRVPPLRRVRRAPRCREVLI